MGDRKQRGRPFQKGNAGRPKGSKDKIPRDSMRALRDYLIQHRMKDMVGAMVRGINSGPKTAHHYVGMVWDRAEGRPRQAIDIKEKQKVEIVFEQKEKEEPDE